MQKLFFSFMIITLFSLQLCATTYTSTALGKWSTGATWVGGNAPTNLTTDTIIINHRVTIDTNVTCATITIQTDTLTFDSSFTRTLTINGDFTINNGGGLRARTPQTTTSGYDYIYLKGNLVNNGAIVGKVEMFGWSGTIEFEMQGTIPTTINGTGANSFFGLSINNSNGVTLNSSCSIMDLYLRQGIFTTNSGNVAINSSGSINRYSSGSITATPSGVYTVTYFGSGNLTTGPELANTVTRIGINKANANDMVTLNSDITISQNILLIRGILNNNNYQVILSNSAYLQKYNAGKITTTPIYQGNNDIYYYSINDTTGIELPSTIGTINLFANNIVLNKNILTNTINLGINKLVTGDNIVTTTNVIRTTGYVQGNLAKSINIGVSVNKTFEVGTANGYSPVTISLNNVTQEGTLIVSPKQNTHFNASTIETLKRYWTINNNGTVFDNYTTTFTYLSVDFNTGVTEINDEATLVVGKYDGGIWTYPNVSNNNIANNAITVDGLTSFSDFAIGKNQASLPVELQSFIATIKNNVVILNWETVTEQNNYGFDVEKSVISNQTSEKQWKKIGFVGGKRNSNEKNTYTFTDKNVLAGKYVYRLKQIDTDGKVSYSEEREIKIVPTIVEVSQNFPNPFNPSTTINYQIPMNNFVTLKVYDVLGKEIATLVNEEKETGIYQVKFDGSKLSSGMYFYKLTAGKSFEIKKMMLVK